MQKIILYTTEHCPRCRILGDLLEKNNIEFVKICDTNLMIEMGFVNAPVLKVDEDTMNYTEAYNWIMKGGFTNEV